MTEVAALQSSYPGPGQPLRKLSAEELNSLAEDGAVCARGIIDATGIEQLRAAVEESIAMLGVINKASEETGTGFSGDVFVWKLHDQLRDMVLFSGFPALAQQVLGTPTVNFFYDQFFVKRAGCAVETPWHQDIPFWPVAGSQIVSFWIALDPVTQDSSGLEFVKGSHKWTDRFKAVSPGYDGYLADTDLPVAPDFTTLRDKHEVIGWDMTPGDALIFGPVICHGSQGNNSNRDDRRAIALRYHGEDVTYAPRHATMPLLWEHGLESGDPLGGSLFPRVWPHVIDAEVDTRMAGPEFPSEAHMDAFKQHLQETGFGPDGPKQTIFF